MKWDELVNVKCHGTWLILVILLSGCNQQSQLQPSNPVSLPTNEEVIEMKEDEQMERSIPIALLIDNQEYAAQLNDSETAQAFIKLMPLTVTMDDLNGNEKFAYLDDTLPTQPFNPDLVNEGQLMLFGSDCLVLFYQGFSTTYSYTQLGMLDQPSNLASIRNERNVEVTFILK